MDNSRLAIDGGTPVRSRPLPPWPYFEQGALEGVDRVLRSGRVNYWTGTEGREFEREFAEFIGARHAVAVANGTVALELALRSLGVGPGDEVIVPPRTFIATGSAVVMVGATPVFADVDPDSQTLTPETVRDALSTRTRAIILVHLAGWPADTKGIADMAHAHGAFVIEDCAQSLGAMRDGRRTGSSSDVAAFSFCQDKIMTTGGEGGMLVTNDEHVWARAWSFKDHGKTTGALDPWEGGSEGFRWLHESFGTNCRMTEMQAAIGRACLPEVDDWVSRRTSNARFLVDALNEFPSIRTPLPPPDLKHAFYKLYTFVRSEMLAPGWTRDRLAEAISAEGWPCMTGSCSEVYRERAFVDAGLEPPDRLPIAKTLGQTSLMFLVHPTLSSEDMSQGAAAISKVLQRATHG